MKRWIALLLAAVMLLTLTGCGEEKKELGPLYTKNSYTADDATVLASRDQTIAAVGSTVLTNGTLQIYYWSAVYDFLSEYGYYAPYFGLDYTKDLDNQLCAENDGTWQHFFLENALNSWHNYQAMALMAKEMKISLSEEYQKKLDGLDQEMADAAKKAGFDGVDAFIQDDMGGGCTYAEYKEYMEVYYLGLEYFNTMLDRYEITDDMISAYFKSHESELKKNNITKESGDVISVRHILIEVAEGKTENDWVVCRSDAQTLLNQWLAGEATEESFAALAKEHSDDGGSSGDGGLYTGLSKDTNFVQEFKDWYLDATRKPGDYGLVKTTYGYHIMYYSGTQPQWIYQCRSMLRNEYSSTIVSTAAARYPITVDYEKILLAKVNLAVTE